ncbi:MAG: Ig-like domain-containing protein [Desulfobacteraceae bacterium]|nr:Ig-like domain-containing protein [Desulfobacteraceae bacterium]
MNPQKKLVLAAILLLAILTTSAQAAPPMVVRTEPANGANGVSTDIGVMRFWFDQNMKQNSWTFWESSQAEFPPKERDDGVRWRDPLCIELLIGKLKPSTTYAVQLNTAKAQGFRSAQSGEPLPQTVIFFTTAIEGEVYQPVGREDLKNAVRIPVGPGSSGTQKQGGLREAAVGFWAVRDQDAEIRFEFNADGRLSRAVQSGGRVETTRGSWRMTGDGMELRFDGDDELLRFSVKMPDANSMELWESPDSGIHLIRAGGAATGPKAAQAPSPATAPLPGTSVDSRPVASGATAQGRPKCVQGWTDFKNPLIGMQACVPGDYWVRLRGGVMLTVEKQGNSGTMAFMMPFRPKAGAGAADIARHFAKFAAESEPRFTMKMAGNPTADRAISSFTSVVSDQPVEGRYCTFVAAGGSMAFVIGVSAPAGRLDSELPTLRQIAQSFGFVPPIGRWIDFQSPAGGFTMSIPQGWVVQSNDAQTPKDNIDWVAFDQKKPLSRVFQWCPRFCSPQLLQDPLHVMRGYQAAQFRNHEQVVTASLGQISQNPKLLKMSVNQPLTRLFRAMNQQVSQLLAGLGAAQMDIVVYDCLGQGQVEGKPVLAAFVAGVQTMAINAGISGQLVDLSVTLRGWCTEPDQFVSDSPVLEKACASMQLSAAFIRKIVQGNEQATTKIRETYAHMNKIDDQIRRSRWDTMDAIAEMNYDNLRETGGYVNEKTGRIEQISPEKVVKNSRGEYVSREEVERGVNPESATVLRDAYSNDYMRGVYGRIEF